MAVNELSSSKQFLFLNFNVKMFALYDNLISKLKKIIIKKIVVPVKHKLKKPIEENFYYFKIDFLKEKKKRKRILLDL